MANSSRRHGMHPILAFILGFLLALIILGGAIAGVVIYALNYKISKIPGNRDSDGNYVYINGDSSNGGANNVLGLVKKITELTTDFSSRTVGDVEKLLPVVAKLVEKLDAALSNYVKLEDGELRAVKFGELSSFISSLQDRIDISNMVSATPDNAILCYLSYGITKVTYDEENDQYVAKYKDEEGNVYDCIVEFDDEGRMDGAYYMDGEEKQEVPHLTFGNSKQRINGVTNDLTIGDVVNIADDDRLLGSVKNSTINSLSGDIGKLSVQQLFVDEIYCIDSSEAAAEGGEAYKAPIYEVVDDTTQLSTVTGAAGWHKNWIYYTFDGTDYSLVGSCGKLKPTERDENNKVLTNCYDPDATYYTLGEGQILYDPAFVYYTQNEDESYTMVKAGKEDAGRLSRSDYKDDTYYSYGAPSALWKLLLYAETSEGSGVKEEKVYAVNNISVMITNVSKNTQHTSMRELDAAGILTFPTKSDLDTHVKWRENGDPHDEVLGEMELTEVISVMVLIMKDPLALIS
ncbi:MAG: hypothetical protein K2K60_04775 [Clostridia bacterium]|nr:hypothetical protein [Clostridia bacterium]